jgi:hypothetical protein
LGLSGAIVATYDAAYFSTKQTAVKTAYRSTVEYSYPSAVEQAVESTNYAAF